MRNDGTYLAQLLQEQQRPHPMHMRQQYHFMGGPGWTRSASQTTWTPSCGAAISPGRPGLDQRSERPGLVQGRVSLFLSV